MKSVQNDNKCFAKSFDNTTSGGDHIQYLFAISFVFIDLFKKLYQTFSGVVSYNLKTTGAIQHLVDLCANFFLSCNAILHKPS